MSGGDHEEYRSVPGCGDGKYCGFRMLLVLRLLCHSWRHRLRPAAAAKAAAGVLSNTPQ